MTASLQSSSGLITFSLDKSTEVACAASTTPINTHGDKAYHWHQKDPLDRWIIARETPEQKKDDDDDDDDEGFSECLKTKLAGSLTEQQHWLQSLWSGNMKIRRFCVLHRECGGRNKEKKKLF